MTKVVDDPTTTDVDDTQVSIEGEYIGPSSARRELRLDVTKPILVTDDQKTRGS